MEFSADIQGRETGDTETLTGDTVQAIAEQIPEDYAGPSVEVRDEAGFLRGWVSSATDWRNA